MPLKHKGGGVWRNKALAAVIQENGPGAHDRGGRVKPRVGPDILTKTV